MRTNLPSTARHFTRTGAIRSRPQECDQIAGIRVAYLVGSQVFLAGRKKHLSTGAISDEGDRESARPGGHQVLKLALRLVHRRDNPATPNLSGVCQSGGVPALAGAPRRRRSILGT